MVDAIRRDNGAPQYDPRTQTVSVEWVEREETVEVEGDESYQQTVLEAVYTVSDKPTDANAYTAAIQSHIDAVARARSYDSGISLAGYKGSPVEAYAADADAFTAWRDPLWVFAFETLAAVQSGQMAQPTISELIAMLPQPPWPVEG